MMVNNNLPLTLTHLPKKLREQLNSCPTQGNGVHSWLFKTALRLHGRFTEGEIVEILKAHLSCSRPGREIIDAIENSTKGSYLMTLATKTPDLPNQPTI